MANYVHMYYIAIDTACPRSTKRQRNVILIASANTFANVALFNTIINNIKYCSRIYKEM